MWSVFACHALASLTILPCALSDMYMHRKCETLACVCVYAGREAERRFASAQLSNSERAFVIITFARPDTDCTPVSKNTTADQARCALRGGGRGRKKVRHYHTLDVLSCVCV